MVLIGPSWPFLVTFFSTISRQDASKDIPMMTLMNQLCNLAPVMVKFTIFTMDYHMWVTPPKWAALPECYQFSKKFNFAARLEKNARVKIRSVSPMNDDRNQRYFLWYFWGPFTFSVALNGLLSRSGLNISIDRGNSADFNGALTSSNKHTQTT